MDSNAGSDRYDLERFVKAQQGVFDRACSELRAGSKRSHWMWFIFPQIHGLGASEMSIRFAISSMEEAHEYLAHPVLGPRLQECTKTVEELEGKSANDIFGYPDYMKFSSSMTLFAKAAGQESVFVKVLDKYFGGEMDAETLKRISLIKGKEER